MTGPRSSRPWRTCPPSRCPLAVSKQIAAVMALGNYPVDTGTLGVDQVRLQHHAAVPQFRLLVRHQLDAGRRLRRHAAA